MFTIDDKHFRLFEVILAPRKTGKSAHSIKAYPMNLLCRDWVILYSLEVIMIEEMLVYCAESQTDG